jgi:hypothetical protein
MLPLHSTKCQAQDYIERDLGIKTLESAQQPNRGRTVLQKLTVLAGSPAQSPDIRRHTNRQALMTVKVVE